MTSVILPRRKSSSGHSLSSCRFLLRPFRSQGDIKNVINRLANKFISEKESSSKMRNQRSEESSCDNELRPSPHCIKAVYSTTLVKANSSGVGKMSTQQMIDHVRPPPPPLYHSAIPANSFFL